MKKKFIAGLVATGLLLAALMPAYAGYWDREELSEYCVVRFRLDGTPVYGTVVYDCVYSWGHSCLPSQTFCYVMPD